VVCLLFAVCCLLFIVESAPFESINESIHLISPRENGTK
jgi:hypothetical protein